MGLPRDACKARRPGCQTLRRKPAYARAMRVIAIALVLLGCYGSKSDNETPKGGKVIEWDASKSTRPAYKTSTFENKTSKDDVISVKACTDYVKLKLHLETATAKYTEAGTQMTIVS